MASFAEGRVRVFASFIEKSSLRDSRNPTTPDLNGRQSSSGRPPPFQGGPPCSQAHGPGPAPSGQKAPGTAPGRGRKNRLPPRWGKGRRATSPRAPAPPIARSQPAPEARGRGLRLRTPALPHPPRPARSGHTLAPALCVFRGCGSHAEPVPRGEWGGGGRGRPQARRRPGAARPGVSGHRPGHAQPPGPRTRPSGTFGNVRKPRPRGRGGGGSGHVTRPSQSECC